MTTDGYAPDGVTPLCMADVTIDVDLDGDSKTGVQQLLGTYCLELDVTVHKISPRGRALASDLNLFIGRPPCRGRPRLPSTPTPSRAPEQAGTQ